MKLPLRCTLVLGERENMNQQTQGS